MFATRATESVADWSFTGVDSDKTYVAIKVSSSPPTSVFW